MNDRVEAKQFVAGMGAHSADAGEPVNHLGQVGMNGDKGVQPVRLVEISPRHSGELPSCRGNYAVDALLTGVSGSLHPLVDINLFSKVKAQLIVCLPCDPAADHEAAATQARHATFAWQAFSIEQCAPPRDISKANWE